MKHVTQIKDSENWRWNQETRLFLGFFMRSMLSALWTVLIELNFALYFLFVFSSINHPFTDRAF